MQSTKSRRADGSRAPAAATADFCGCVRPTLAGVCVEWTYAPRGTGAGSLHSAQQMVGCAARGGTVAVISVVPSRRLTIGTRTMTLFITMGINGYACCKSRSSILLAAFPPCWM